MKKLLTSREVLWRLRNNHHPLDLPNSSRVIFTDGRKASGNIMKDLLERKLVVHKDNVWSMSLCSDCGKAKLLHEINDGCPKMSEHR